MFGIDDYILYPAKWLYKKAFHDSLVKEGNKLWNYYRDPIFGKPEIKHNTYYIYFDYRFFKDGDYKISRDGVQVTVDFKIGNEDSKYDAFRHTIEKFKLPEEVDKEKFSCKLDDKPGFLMCDAPLIKEFYEDGSRKIRVERIKNEKK